MKSILLSGCNGKMGKVIVNCVENRDDCVIAAGFDIAGNADYPFPVITDLNNMDAAVDVIIDFSHPTATMKIARFAQANKIPLCVATTGLSQQDIAEIKNVSCTTPVFTSFNMSLGVNLMIELAKKAASVLGDSFNVEIIEKHHNQKLDSPSGTAIMLADAISTSLPYQSQYIYDRHSIRKKREKTEIGIHSVRGGTIVGEHEVIFAGRDEILTISHSAMSREIFATGAISAALFISDQMPGLYNMGDLVASK